jgi:hypothetical protein|uniref:Uncharacterized protein n=1 Tax=Sipha flava TaxID=143950 RepID=A0A2S2PYK5_9HEMI
MHGKVDGIRFRRPESFGNVVSIESVIDDRCSYVPGSRQLTRVSKLQDRVARVGTGGTPGVLRFRPGSSRLGAHPTAEMINTNHARLRDRRIFTIIAAVQYSFLLLC